MRQSDIQLLFYLNKMKAKEKSQKKGFDTVQTFRKIKDKISMDLKGMNFEEIKEYLKRQSLKLQTE